MGLFFFPLVFCLSSFVLISVLYFYFPLACFWFDFLLFYLKMYLFLAALGLCWCAWAFSSCSEQGLLFPVVHGLHCVAPLVGQHGL